MPSTRRGGRPSKLTPETIEALTTAIACGVPYAHARAAAGISESTLRRWIQRGEEQETGEFREFCDLLARAKAQGIVVKLLAIKEAGQRDWRALAWLLERQDPENYSLKFITENRKTTIGTDRGQPEVNTDQPREMVSIPIDAQTLDRLTDEELMAFESILKKMEGIKEAQGETMYSSSTATKAIPQRILAEGTSRSRTGR